MIPFSAKTVLFKTKVKILKGTAKLLPFPKPTLFSGPGSSLELCEAIAQMGTRRVLIVTDATLVQIGLIDDMKSKLAELGIETFIYDGVEPDPTIDQIEAGLEMLKKHDCEAILAVGGGSPIDAAKVIAARATNDKPIRKMEGLFRVFRATLPLYAVPTTAGTGSEVTVAALDFIGANITVPHKFEALSTCTSVDVGATAVLLGPDDLDREVRVLGQQTAVGVEQGTQALGPDKLQDEIELRMHEGLSARDGNRMAVPDLHEAQDLGLDRPEGLVLPRVLVQVAAAVAAGAARVAPSGDFQPAVGVVVLGIRQPVEVTDVDPGFHDFTSVDIGSLPIADQSPVVQVHHQGIQVQKRVAQEVSVQDAAADDAGQGIDPVDDPLVGLLQLLGTHPGRLINTVGRGIELVILV